MIKFKALSVAGLIVVMCVSLFAQRGRGTRTPPAPRPTGPVADVTDAIIAAINSQDAAFLRTALSQDAIMVDEDGHIGVPANVWALRLTNAAKKVAISNLMIGDQGDSGAWAAFNYTIDETTKGSGTIVYSKSGTVLKAVLIQMSVNGPAITPH